MRRPGVSMSPTRESGFSGSRSSLFCSQKKRKNNIYTSAEGIPPERRCQRKKRGGGGGIAVEKEVWKPRSFDGIMATPFAKKREEARLRRGEGRDQKGLERVVE